MSSMIKLITNIQTLESMGKEKDIRGYVRLTLDKLPGIRADLVGVPAISRKLKEVV